MQLIKHLGFAAARWSLLVAVALLINNELAGLAVAGRGTRGTPEIDPGSIGSAITLFVGGAMYLTSRRRAN